MIWIESPTYVLTMYLGTYVRYIYLLFAGRRFALRCDCRAGVSHSYHRHICVQFVTAT